MTGWQTRLVETHVRYVCWLAARHPAAYLVGPDDAAAAALEGLCKAAGGYRPELGPFRPYARVRAIGALGDLARQASTTTRAERAAGVTRPVVSLDATRGLGDRGDLEPGYDLVDADDTFAALVGRLPARERVVVLMLCDGWTQAEIADVLGLSAGRVSQIVTGIRGRLTLAESATYAVC